MIKMTLLKSLYYQMKENNVTQYVFPYDVRDVKFSILFDCETTPFTLLFGILKENIFFLFNVEKGFVIKETKIEKSTYYKLIKLFKMKYSSSNKFTPSEFLKEFNSISLDFKKIKQATFYERVPFFSDVEEVDKVYFQKWLVHTGKRKVTEKNLEKTRKWLGEKVYKQCRERNISTCWTANKEESINPYDTSLHECVILV